VAIRIQTEDDSVSLIFEDNGPGFSPEVLPLLFDGRVKGRGSDGHGLGLAFIDAVARAHDGTVTAANPETGGAQVTVTLPLVSSENIVSFNAVHAAN
jgi:signal transduction histidine kinase